MHTLHTIKILHLSKTQAHFAQCILCVILAYGHTKQPNTILIDNAYAREHMNTLLIVHSAIVCVMNRNQCHTQAHVQHDVVHTSQQL